MTFPMRLPTRLARWADQFAAAELCYGVDPYILAAIIDRESLGGDALKPEGPGGKGDGGHGHGLGQIDDRSHGAFLSAKFDDGLFLWEDPTFNILYAARLLKRNLKRADGDLHVAIAAYNCGFGNARKALVGLDPGDVEGRLEALDKKTAGGDYVSDVIRRRDDFLQLCS